MILKLALRNIRRQTSSYIIYFITVVIAVGMMFAINNVLFADELWSYTPSWASDILRSVMVMVIVIVTAIVCAIICYATAFLLRKRKKEFGIYLLLGISRDRVMKMFIIENLIIGVISVAAGCGFGLVAFAAIGLVISALMNNVIEPLSLSAGSLVITLLQWIVIFAIALTYCSAVLRKTKISDLIVGKTNEKFVPKYPWIERTLAFIAFGGICFGSIFAVVIVRMSFGIGSPAQTLASIPIAAFILFGSIFLFYICLRSVYFQKLKRKTPKTIYMHIPALLAPATPAPDSDARRSVGTEYRDKAYKGSNVFFYRRMSCSMNRNAVMIALIAVVLSLAVIAMNVTFSIRNISLSGIDYSYDVFGCWNGINDFSHVSPEEVAEDARSYSELSFLRIFDVYDTAITENSIFEAKVMKLSDYNAVAVELGEAEIRLADNEYYYFSSSIPSETTVELYGQELICAGYSVSFNNQADTVIKSFTNTYGYGIGYLVPDSVITEDVAARYVSMGVLTMNTVNHLPKEFNEKYRYRSVVRNRYAEIDSVNAQFSIPIIATIFLAVTFMLLAMALLSLKVMSDVDLDRKRYGILNMLGVSAARRRRILFRQQFSFFAAPLFIPLLMTLPSIAVGLVIGSVFLGTFHAAIFGIGFAIPLIYIAIYTCYFVATYYLSERSCIKVSEKRRVKLLGKKEAR